MPDDSTASFADSHVYDILDDDQQMLIDIEQNIANLERSYSIGLYIMHKVLDGRVDLDSSKHVCHFFESLFQSCRKVNTNILCYYYRRDYEDFKSNKICSQKYSKYVFI